MLASLAALVLAAGDLRLETSLAAGGGYESNLSHAALAEDAVGAAFVSLRGAVGLSVDAGARTGLYAGLRLDYDGYQDVSDLSTTSAGADVSLVRELGERWAVVLAPTGSYAWSGDSARDVATVGGRVTLRVKPTPALALRAFYGYAWGEADDPVFSSRRSRAGLGAEWRVAARTYLSLSYAAERGDEIFYRPAPVVTTMRGMGPGPGSVYREGEVADSTLALSHAATPALEIGLGRAVLLRASYELRRVHMWGEAPDFTNHTGFAGLVLQR